MKPISFHSSFTTTWLFIVLTACIVSPVIKNRLWQNSFTQWRNNAGGHCLEFHVAVGCWLLNIGRIIWCTVGITSNAGSRIRIDWRVSCPMRSRVSATFACNWRMAARLQPGGGALPQRVVVVSEQQKSGRSSHRGKDNEGSREKVGWYRFSLVALSVVYILCGSTNNHASHNSTFRYLSALVKQFTQR